MVHPSSHKNPNDISGYVHILGEMLIFLDCLLMPDIGSVSICDEFIVILYGSLSTMSFYIITGSIDGVDFFGRCLFAPGSAIASVCLLG